MTKADDRQAKETKPGSELTKCGGPDKLKGAGKLASRGGGPDKAKGVDEDYKGGGPDKAKDTQPKSKKTSASRTTRKKKKANSVPVER